MFFFPMSVSEISRLLHLSWKKATTSVRFFSFSVVCEMPAPILMPIMFPNINRGRQIHCLFVSNSLSLFLTHTHTIPKTNCLGSNQTQHCSNLSENQLKKILLWVKINISFDKIKMFCLDSNHLQHFYREWKLKDLLNQKVETFLFRKCWNKTFHFFRT